MYSKSTIFFYAAMATTAISTPINRTDDEILITAPSTTFGVREQNPEHVAVIESLGFQNPKPTNTMPAGTLCSATDIPCVMGHKPSATPSSKPVAKPIEVGKRDTAGEIEKRDPQTMSLGDAYAAAGLPGIRSKPQNATAIVGLCAASDTKCVVKRNTQLRIEDSIAEKKRALLERQTVDLGTATNAAGINGPAAAANPSASPSAASAKCPASDTNCVVGRSISERKAQSNT